MSRVRRGLRVRTIAAVAAVACIVVGGLVLALAANGEGDEGAGVSSANAESRSADPLYYMKGAHVVATFSSASVVDEFTTVATFKALVWVVQTDRVVGDFYYEDFNGASELRLLEPLNEDGHSIVRSFLESNRDGDHEQFLLVSEIPPSLYDAAEAGTGLLVIDAGRRLPDGTVALEFATDAENAIVNEMLSGKPDFAAALVDITLDLRAFYRGESTTGPTLEPFVHLLIPERNDDLWADEAQLEGPGVPMVIIVDGPQTSDTAGTVVWFIDQDGQYQAGVELDGFTAGYLETVPAATSQLEIIVADSAGVERSQKFDVSGIEPDGGLVLSLTADGVVQVAEGTEPAVVDAAGVEAATKQLIEAQSGTIVGGPSTLDEVGETG